MTSYASGKHSQHACYDLLSSSTWNIKVADDRLLPKYQELYFVLRCEWSVEASETEFDGHIKGSNQQRSRASFSSFLHPGGFFSTSSSSFFRLLLSPYRFCFRSQNDLTIIYRFLAIAFAFSDSMCPGPSFSLGVSICPRNWRQSGVTGRKPTLRSLTEHNTRPT